MADKESTTPVGAIALAMPAAEGDEMVASNVAVALPPPPTEEMPSNAIIVAPDTPTVAETQQVDVEMVAQDDQVAEQFSTVRESIDSQTKERYYKPATMRLPRWEEPEERPKRSGWGAQTDKTFTPMCFSHLPPNMSHRQVEIWIRRHRIDDLQARIQAQDYEQNDADIRSPSPEPVYDSKTGLRQNTREQRLKDKYYKERLRLIDEVIALDPTYTPPPDYKPPKKQRKIYIPEPNNPSLNYIGQIIGPGGQTQQKLEKESKCRISVRGNGAQNRSKIYNREEWDEEPLYVLVTAESDEDLEKGCAMIESILHQTDEAKKLKIVVYDHLTLRRVWCESCGQQGHKFQDCPEKLLSNSAAVLCSFCHSKSHPTSDCPIKHKRRQQQQAGVKDGDGVTAGMDGLEDNHEEEFYRFMQDQSKRKQERERLKMLTYEEQQQQRAAGEGGYTEEGPNSLALVPLRDYDGMEYDGAEFDQNAGYNPEMAQVHALRKKRLLMEKMAGDEREELSIAEQMRRKQQQHWQGHLQTQVGAQSSFKAKIKEPTAPSDGQQPPTNQQYYEDASDSKMNDEKQPEQEEADAEQKTTEQQQ